MISPVPTAFSDHSNTGMSGQAATDSAGSTESRRPSAQSTYLAFPEREITLPNTLRGTDKFDLDAHSARATVSDRF